MLTIVIGDIHGMAAKLENQFSPPTLIVWIGQSALALWFKDRVSSMAAVLKRRPSWRWRASCWSRCGNM